MMIFARAKHIEKKTAVVVDCTLDQKSSFSEKSIQKLVASHFLSTSTIKYQIENLMVYNWESDSLLITRSDLVYEFEIKISKADFKNDFKHKVEKHQILEGIYEPQYPKWYSQPPKYNINENRPNYFYYVVPNGLIEADDVPSYAGLIYAENEWPYLRTVKKAPKIHSEKIDYEKMRLRDKFYFNYLTWKGKAEGIYDLQIESLKQQLKETRCDENGNHYRYNIAEANEKLKTVDSMYKSCQEQLKSTLKDLDDNRDLIYFLEDIIREQGMSRIELHNKKAEFWRKRKE